MLSRPVPGGVPDDREVSMTTSFVRLAAAAAISLCASLALAQTTPAPKPAAAAPKPAATAPAPAPAPAAATAPAGKPAMSAKGAECSKEADAKGLHGKARKKFRSACKRGKTQG